MEIMWGVLKGKNDLYAYPLSFDLIQVYHKNYYRYLTIKIQKLQLEQIYVSWLYDPLGVFTIYHMYVNSKALYFFKLSINELENHRKNFEIGPFFSNLLLNTSCMILWKKNYVIKIDSSTTINKERSLLKPLQKRLDNSTWM